MIHDTTPCPEKKGNIKFFDAIFTLVKINPPFFLHLFSSYFPTQKSNCFIFTLRYVQLPLRENEVIIKWCFPCKKTCCGSVPSLTIWHLMIFMHFKMKTECLEG